MIGSFGIFWKDRTDQHTREQYAKTIQFDGKKYAPVQVSKLPECFYSEL